MTSNYDRTSPRLFADDCAVRRIGLGLVSCTLPRVDWTHEAHLGACLWLLDERPEFNLEIHLPTIIRRYNVSVGGVNDDEQGYHETLTQLYVAGVRLFSRTCPIVGLAARANRLLIDPIGDREWPLTLYSPDRLFSAAARRERLLPDLGSWPEVTS